MSASQTELKEIREQKKALLEKQRELQAKADEGKEERKVARKEQAEARKTVREHKSAVRDLSANIYSTFSTGDAEAVNTLADELMESSTKLVEAVRSFGSASEKLEEL
jgi:predicted nuclease with TOPRIM domain